MSDGAGSDDVGSDDVGSAAASSACAKQDRRWPAWLRLHVPVLLGVTGCAWAGWFEWTRALAGRQVAWVYAAEWPILAVVGVAIWWRLWREETVHRVDGSLPQGARTFTSTAARNHVDAAGTPHVVPGPVADQELMAWQEYLARLQAADPPGGPPQRGLR